MYLNVYIGELNVKIKLRQFVEYSQAFNTLIFYESMRRCQRNSSAVFSDYLRAIAAQYRVLRIEWQGCLMYVISNSF
jgi:hypothetical protein